METLYISFDIASKVTGICIYFQNKWKTFTMIDTYDKIINNKKNIIDMFKPFFKNAKDVIVIFENLGLGRNGLMFSEIIGVIKYQLHFLAESYSKPFQYNVYRPNTWTFALFKKKGSRKEMKALSIENAKKFHNINNDDEADALNLLLYYLKKNDLI